MTCREKLKIEHPEHVKNDCWAGCTGCPHSYGYMPSPDYCPYTGNTRTSLGLYERQSLCIRCWNRDIPEQESGDKSEFTESKPRISNMLDLLWFVEKVMANGDKMVSIDIYPDNMSVNVYPYPLKQKEGEDK